MAKRTIYVREEDEALFDKLAEEGNLSAVIARAVKADKGEVLVPTGKMSRAHQDYELYSPGQLIEFSVEKAEPKSKKPVSAVSLLVVDALAIEVGKGLVSVVDPNQGAVLLERIPTLRQQLAVELGIILPGVRFRDNLRLRPNQYQIAVRDVVVASGEVEVNHFLVLPHEGKLPAVPGKPGKDPVTEGTALWVSPEQRDGVKAAGFTSLDPVTVIVSHLRLTAERHAPALVSLQETQALLDTVGKTHPAVVKAAIPGFVTLVQFWQVLRALLREGVSIRDLVLILETLILTGGFELSAAVEACRLALRTVICRTYTDTSGRLPCLTMSLELEAQLRASEPSAVQAALVQAVQQTSCRVLLVPADVRPVVRALVPHATVLSDAETSGCELDVRAVVS